MLTLKTTLLTDRCLMNGANLSRVRRHHTLTQSIITGTGSLVHRKCVYRVYTDPSIARLISNCQKRS